MKVTATAKGYMGSIREPGDVFEVADGLKGSWFTPVPEEPKATAKLEGKGGPKKPAPADKAAQGDPGDDEAII